MGEQRTIFHLVECPNPSRDVWEAFGEADHRHKALYAWAPDAWERRNPPEPVRRALWRGLAAAGGGTVGFTAGRGQLGPGSVWRKTAQGWFARRFRPLPGMLWTGDAETFDACFDGGWADGAQVAFALADGRGIPDLPADLMQRWLDAEAGALPPMPAGVRLAVKAGADGGLFAVFGHDGRALDRFADAFRAGLDWRTTTSQRVLEPQLGPTLVRLSARKAGPPAEDAGRWFERPGDERMRR